MTVPALSVLIRARDSAATIGALLGELGRQRLAASTEIVIVDSGSTDGTLELVRQQGLEPIAIPAAEFTYGRALNLAAAAAAAPICVALSAHVSLPDEDWSRRMLAAFGDERVACAFGQRVDPELRPLEQPILQDHEQARRNPLFGYSNSAGGFRRELWEDHAFDEGLPASEDKEWAWHWLQAGRLVLLDPGLAVAHSHRDEGPLRTFRRVRGDVAACRTFSPVPQMSLGGAVREWAAGSHAHRSRVRALADPRRVAMIAGKWAGSR